MDVLAAYRDVGTFRGAAAVCGTTHKTVKKIIEAHEAGERPQRTRRSRNFDPVADLVVERVARSAARISAKRLLPAAQAAGYAGSARNFRRLVAQVKAEWRRDHHRGRRPGVWTPGETLIIDWGVEAGVHVFCAVLAWSRFRFVRFASDERAGTTFGLLAECFETLGGVPKTVLADRMGCLKAGVVANLVVPTADYVRFATHYRFRPDFCEAHDPESKGMVEHLVGYAKRDLIVPQQPFDDLGTANTAAAAWCAEVNAVVHSEICTVPAERLAVEQALLGPLPSLRLELGARPTTRKVDKLSCVRFGSARYSVPCRLIGHTVTITTTDKMIMIMSRSPAKCWPSTYWWRRVRRALLMIITTVPGRTGHAAHPDPEPKWRRISWPSVTSPNSSWSAPPPPGYRSCRPSWPRSCSCSQRTAPTPS